MKTVRYWKEHGYFECNSFEEVFQREKYRLDNII